MRSKRGRPRLEIHADHRRAVIVLVESGLPHHLVSYVIGVSRATLEARFRKELDIGHARRLKLARMEPEAGLLLPRLFQVARRGHGPKALAAVIYLLRHQYGWSEDARPG
jgi:hypothetical protein